MTQIKGTKYHGKYKSGNVALLGIVFGEKKGIKCILGVVIKS
jgi:hypothetical protein